jgi:hypothetical protein
LRDRGMERVYICSNPILDRRLEEMFGGLMPAMVTPFDERG